MRYSISAASKLAPVLLFSACVMVLMVLPTPVQAQDTTVNVAVCGTGSGAQLTIDQPENDSVVDQPAVTVSGQVSSATQIDITVDGQYNSTVPLSVQQTTYSADVHLTAGTHTIELVANDVCQVQDATASVVITYQPQTTPSTGGDTPTTISGGGAVIDGNGVTPDSNSQFGPEKWPVIGPLVGLGRDLAVALDFETGQEGGTSTFWRSMLRFLFVVVGISLIIFGPPAWARRKGSPPASGSRQAWAIRIAGALLVLLAFLI